MINIGTIVGDMDAKTDGSVGLRIQVNKQNIFAESGKIGRQIYCGGSLPNSALLIADAYDASHNNLILYHSK